MNRIVYISTSYLPFRRADSMHVANMCEELARQGFKTSLVHKGNSQFREETESIYEFYGVQDNFSLVPVSRPSWKGGGVVYMAGVFMHILLNRNRIDIIYSRDIVGGILARLFNIELIFELHYMPRAHWLVEKILFYSRLQSLVVISQALKDDLLLRFKLLPEHKVIVAHDAFTIKKQQADVIPINSNTTVRIGYAGSLYPGKGMEIILALAKRFPSIQFEVVGGEEKDILKWREKNSASNLLIEGFIPPAQLQEFYKRQSILLLPPLKTSLGMSGNDIARWMSPMKMFEYMHSGIPIVASAIPVLKEVLTHEHNALLADPENLEEWVFCIKRLLSSPELASRLAINAFNDLKAEYTWEKRVSKIMKNYKNNNHSYIS